MSIIDKVHLKCDVIDGSVLYGVRQPILFNFVLDNKPGFKVFCEPGTIQYKKNKSKYFKTITFYLEDDNNEEIKFNGETLTSTLQRIRI